MRLCFAVEILAMHQIAEGKGEARVDTLPALFLLVKPWLSASSCQTKAGGLTNSQRQYQAALTETNMAFGSF